MTYDRARQRVLLVTRGLPSAETWEWDGHDWQQRSVSAPAVPLGPLAYDRERQRVVLVGGDIAGSAAETWAWDGSGWTRESFSGLPPRTDFGLGYDAVRRRTVLFGGATATGTRFPDTWEWDGTAWLQRSPPASPSGREDVQLVFDERRQRMLLLGGLYEGTSAPRDAVWEWDGHTWTLVTRELEPENRYTPGVVWHDARQSVILYGGVQLRREAFLELLVVTHLRDDLWEWKGGHWTALSDTPRFGTYRALAEDVARGRIVLFGGDDIFLEYPDPLLDETWEWDGARWRELHPASVPQARVQHAMVGDGTRVVLFGGRTFGPSGGLPPQNDTWTWDGTHWKDVSPAQSPPARVGHAMAYDAARRQIVLFGGSSVSGPLADTWTFDAATWTQHVTAVAPQARATHEMAYDAARQQVVLYGGGVGGQRFDDTWTWDGTSWIQQSPAVRPSTGSISMTYHAARQRVVLFVNSRSQYETWEWDGAQWALTTPPPALFGNDHRMVYDTAREVAVLFWADSSGSHAETWTYGPGPAAAVVPYGQGCAGSRGVPDLEAFGLPSLGRASFALDLALAPPRAPAAIVLGSAPAQIPLPGSCALLVDPTARTVAVLTETSALGTTSVSMPIPLVPTLRGVTLAAQGFVVDPAGALGVAFSRGLSMTIGE